MPVVTDSISNNIADISNVNNAGYANTCADVLHLSKNPNTAKISHAAPTSYRNRGQKVVTLNNAHVTQAKRGRSNVRILPEESDNGKERIAVVCGDSNRL